MRTPMLALIALVVAACEPDLSPTAPALAEPQEVASTLHGWVRDAVTGAPLEVAQVAVEGEAVGALVGPDGSFEIPLPPHLQGRTLTLTARLIGYAAETREVGPGDAFRGQEFGLHPTALGLTDCVIVTGIAQALPGTGAGAPTPSP